MATTQFPLFLNLPTEIQIQIWSFAFHAEDPYQDPFPTSRATLMKYMNIKRMPRLHFSQPHAPAQDLYFLISGICNNVMYACRLSRLVALQEWMKVMEKAQVSHRHTVAMEVKKDRALKIFGGLIEEMRERMAGA